MMTWKSLTLFYELGLKHGVEYLGDRTVVCYNNFSTLPTGDVGVTAIS